MEELEEYLNMLRPKKEDRAILLYGSQYKLWLLGKYIGTATWMNDEYLGDSFQNHVMVNGELLQFVYVADKFELVIKSRRQKGTN